MADVFIDPVTEVVPTLETKEECELVLKQLQKQVDDLIYQSAVVARKNKRAVETAGQLQVDLATAKSIKEAYDTTVATLPADSPSLQIFEDELVKIEYKIFNYENRLEKQGKAALINYSLENNAITAKRTSLETILTEVESKKTSLPA